MRTKDIVEGMTILLKYYDDPAMWHTGAEHEVIYMYATDNPVTPEDLTRLVGLGWFQHEVEPVRGGNFEVMDYDKGEGWAAHV